MPIVYLGLGSNLGERKENITKAIELLLAKDMTLKTVAPLYVSRALGFDGEEFYNTVVCVETDMDGYDLIDAIDEIEKAMGRKEYEPQPKNEEKIYHNRIIDIDVLLYDDSIFSNSTVTIPHRSISERDFVLRPLLDIDADLINPMSDEPFSQALANLEEENKAVLDVIHDWYT